jgi:ferredoxin
MEGFDICFTELMGGQHRFLIEIGSSVGEEIMAEIPTEPATQADIDAVDKLMHDAAGHMGRKLETEGLKDALYAASNHSHWEEIAQKCLCCGNCTLVCPTCFCTTVVDTTDLTGEKAERWRRWDSCFSQEFSYIHGGSVRLSSMSRYRQWLTHKLASWNDQFGDPGCVGCGRCITWCPVGIDITEEAKALRIADQSQKGGSV